ncbi:hypothetical protein l11_10860 [Neisseria weaveri LMG 5135]|nr:hypothetical protein l11_10860 [Neisseria weaveri LMG 5135]
MINTPKYTPILQKSKRFEADFVVFSTLAAIPIVPDLSP